jgi:DNA-binding CsgD family transcriptional regulator
MGGGAVLSPLDSASTRLTGLFAHRSTRDCAQVLGIGRETVRQTCLRAFRRLRGTHAGEALLDYVD